MKKTLKSLSIIILFLAICVVPLLAGCAKTYIVDVSVTGGNQNGGLVTANGGKSVYGKNAVSEGEDFMFTISASTGYFIKEIKVDGKLYNESYNKYSYEFILEDVEKDSTIEVTFDLDTFIVEIYCCENDGESNLGWGAKPTPYKTYTIKYGNTFNGLLEFGASNNIFFYANEQTQNRVYIDTTEGLNIWSVGTKGATFKVYTEKTEAELDALASVE